MTAEDLMKAADLLERDDDTEARRLAALLREEATARLRDEGEAVHWRFRE